MRLNFLAKYGTLITFIVMIVIGLLTYMIKYPDTIDSIGVLSAHNAPKPLIAKQNSFVQEVFIKDGADVAEGQILILLETTATIDDVLILEQQLNVMSTALYNRAFGDIDKVMNNTNLNLGELEADYQAFRQAYIPFKNFVIGNYANQKKELLRKDISIIERNKAIIRQQQGIAREDYDINNEMLVKNKQLLKEKIISQEEYNQILSQHIAKRQTEPQAASQLNNTESQINANRKELLEIDNEINNQYAIFSSAIDNLKAKIQLWKINYLIIAGANGKVSYNKIIQPKQIIEAGKTIGVIMPDSSSYYIESRLPQINFGKAAIGQEVIVRFPAYPWQEYGIVHGTLSYISPVIVDSAYLSKITLPNNLKSNYDISIPYKEGLRAEVSVITKDMSLAERFYYDIIKQFRK